MSVIVGPPSCVNGTTIYVQMQAQTVANSAERYDIGYWVATSPGGDAKTGSCYIDNLATPLTTTATPVGNTRESPFIISR